MSENGINVILISLLRSLSVNEPLQLPTANSKAKSCEKYERQFMEKFVSLSEQFYNPHQ